MPNDGIHGHRCRQKDCGSVGYSPRVLAFDHDDALCAPMPDVGLPATTRSDTVVSTYSYEPSGVFPVTGSYDYASLGRRIARHATAKPLVTKLGQYYYGSRLYELTA
jgi:hypothetical protein